VAEVQFDPTPCFSAEFERQLRYHEPSALAKHLSNKRLEDGTLFVAQTEINDRAVYYESAPGTSFESVVFDEKHQAIYIADSNNNKIIKTDLDGNVLNPQLNQTSTPISHLALDPNAGKLYFSDGSSLWRVSLDGLVEESFGARVISDMVIDPVNNLLYWCDGAAPSYIKSVPLPSGTTLGTPTDVAASTSAVQILDFAIDGQRGKIYWSEGADVYEASVTGGPTTWNYTTAYSLQPLALDTQAQRLYWFEDQGAAMGDIQYKKIGDSSPAESIVDDLYLNPMDLDLDLWP
jgi:hypothetical protein